jgi:hypothetical protein
MTDMFVRYYVEMLRPTGPVADALLHRPEAWMPALAEDAERRQGQLMSQVGLTLDGHRVEKAVEVTLGEAVPLGDKSILPISWRAAAAESLFPVMEADLEVAPLGPERTMLAMSARYRPPMGAFGRAIDRTILHRVAEATIKDFLDRVAIALEALVPSPDVASVGA